MDPSCIHGRDPGKLSNSQKCPSHHLKYRSQLKTKERCWGEGASYGRFSGKAQWTRLCRFRSLPSPLIRVSRGLESPLSSKSLPGTERETPLQMEISLVNVNVSYKRVTSTQLSELFPCLLFLKKLSAQNNPYVRGIFWGGNSASLHNQTWEKMNAGKNNCLYVKLKASKS